jgi:hypothetical protein
MNQIRTSDPAMPSVRAQVSLHPQDAQCFTKDIHTPKIIALRFLLLDMQKSMLILYTIYFQMKALTNHLFNVPKTNLFTISFHPLNQRTSRKTKL